jgi:hypothetical protein
MTSNSNAASIVQTITVSKQQSSIITLVCSHGHAAAILSRFKSLKFSPAHAPPPTLLLSTWTYSQVCEEGLLVGDVGWQPGCTVIVKHLPPPAPVPPQLPSPLARPVSVRSSSSFSSSYPGSSSSSSSSSFSSSSSLFNFQNSSYQPLSSSVPFSPFPSFSSSYPFSPFPPPSFDHQPAASNISFQQRIESQQQQKQQSFSPFPPPNPFSPSFLTSHVPAPWSLQSRLQTAVFNFYAFACGISTCGV